MSSLPHGSLTAPRIFAFLLISPLLVVAAQAQGGLTRGTISGTVADTTGAAIPSASITVSSPHTAARRTTVSGPDGEFTIGNLDSGTYTIEIHAHGFAPYRNESITVAVGRISRW